MQQNGVGGMGGLQQARAPSRRPLEGPPPQACPRRTRRGNGSRWLQQAGVAQAPGGCRVCYTETGSQASSFHWLNGYSDFAYNSLWR